MFRHRWATCDRYSDWSQLIYLSICSPSSSLRVWFCTEVYFFLFFRESVSGLRTFLLEQTAAGGDQQVLDYVTDLLNKQVGFLFNERYVNIPAQVGNFLKCILCFKYSYFNFHLEHFIFVLVLYKVGK